MLRAALLLAAAALAAGCASFDGRGLVPGRSDAAEAEALMGAPAMRRTLANGDTALYFSRLPWGRAMFVATFGPDGLLKGVEQRLTRENFTRIAPGASTKDQVLELLGPPGGRGYFARQGREWWEYKYYDYDKRVLYVQFSADGVVREAIDMIDPEEVRPAVAS